MEMNGGSSASYLARTPRILWFVLCFIRVETEGLFRLPISIVRWNLRPVIFGAVPQHLPTGNLKCDTPLRAEKVGATGPFEGV